ncbi:MAG: amidohydrolase [Bacillota bacterium]|nr:amidohydrolase [Bacillota bacterium]
MSIIAVKEAVIITLDPDRPAFFRGDILIEKEYIHAITEHPNSIETEHSVKVIDGKNLIIIPGLINTHGHTAMTLFRSYADDLPLQEWLENKIWPAEELLESNDVYWGTLLGIAEMIKSGTTTFTDMYFFMDRVAEATEESGIRAMLSRGLIGLGSSAQEGLEETEGFIRDWHGRGNGRINVSLGPHAPYTCPPEFLKKVITMAEKYNRPLQIHVSETKKEVDDCIKDYGLTPPKLLYDTGLFDCKTIAAHCVHLTDEDIELMAEKDVGIAHNPGSNLKLGSGIAPVSKMLSKGLKVGIGTDGTASNNNLDMIEEIRFAALLEKGLFMDPTRINAETALKMATSMGAEVLGLPSTGVIKEGFKADLIGLKTDLPHWTPMNNPMANLVYSSAAADVDLVIVDGRILMENRTLKTLDEEKIRFEASRCARRLLEGR